MSDDHHMPTIKPATNGSNRVTYQSRMTWAFSLQGWSDHHTASTIPAAYITADNVNKKALLPSLQEVMKVSKKCQVMRSRNTEVTDNKRNLAWPNGSHKTQDTTATVLTVEKQVSMTGTSNKAAARTLMTEARRFPGVPGRRGPFRPSRRASRNRQSSAEEWDFPCQRGEAITSIEDDESNVYAPQAVYITAPFIDFVQQLERPPSRAITVIKVLLLLARRLTRSRTETSAVTTHSNLRTLRLAAQKYRRARSPTQDRIAFASLQDLSRLRGSGGFRILLSKRDQIKR